MKGKKGLSTVVTTLIIILLVLVAVGIIWGVVSNLLKNSTGKIDATTKCLDVDFTVKNVIYAANGNTTDYTVTMAKAAGSVNEDLYLAVTFFTATNSSARKTFDTAFATVGDVKTKTFAATGVVNATSMDYTPYFVDETGENQYCGTVSHVFRQI